MNILGVDLGTTSLKMGLYQMHSETDYKLIDSYSESYELNAYKDAAFSDIQPLHWIQSFLNGCSYFGSKIQNVEAIGISGTTPGFTPIGKDGEPLHPAILMLDQRSQKQANEIIERVGLDEMISRTGNMPVAGGCSLASLLWLRDSIPGIEKEVAKYGHSNTFFASWLTGSYAIDPSSASLFGLNNAKKNNLEWDDDLLREFNIPQSVLPNIVPAYNSIGLVKESIRREIGFKSSPEVIIGGNDAAVAMYSQKDLVVGDTVNVNGTCEVSSVYLDRFLPSPSYNIRSHIDEGLWLTLYVMNAGGKAYEWFKNLFCSEMNNEQFFEEFIPFALAKYQDIEPDVSYVPYLMGSRYSLKQLKGGFLDLSQTTTREEMVVSMIRSLCAYQRDHLIEMNKQVKLTGSIYITGGVVNKAIIEAKQRWYWEADYQYKDQLPMLGAAMLAARSMQTK